MRGDAPVREKARDTMTDTSRAWHRSAATWIYEQCGRTPTGHHIDTLAETLAAICGVYGKDKVSDAIADMFEAERAVKVGDPIRYLKLSRSNRRNKGTHPVGKWLAEHRIEDKTPDGQHSTYEPISSGQVEMNRKGARFCMDILKRGRGGEQLDAQKIGEAARAAGLNGMGGAIRKHGGIIQDR